MPIDLNRLPPEERDAILQFGKISRPFSKELKAQTFISRLADFYYSLQEVQVWEIVGCDLSIWNGDTLDYSMLKSKVHFAITRGGYGNDWFDPTLNPNINGFVANGIIPGIYWYVKPGKDFHKHASSFWSVVKIYDCPLYPMFDLEETGGLGKTALESWYKKMYDQFCSMSGLQLGQVMTYTSAGFLNTALGLTSWLKFTKLDVAHWTTAPDPLLPNEWKTPGLPWKMWQHCVCDATGYGVESAKIDLQRYNGTRTQFNSEFGVNVPPPAPPPTPAYIMVNLSELNIRPVPNDDPTTAIMGKTPLGKVWKTTGKSFWDKYNRGWWYQVADEHGQELYLAGWLCKPL